MKRAIVALALLTTACSPAVDTVRTLPPEAETGVISTDIDNLVMPAGAANITTQPGLNWSATYEMDYSLLVARTRTNLPGELGGKLLARDHDNEDGHTWCWHGAGTSVTVHVAADGTATATRHQETCT